MPYSCHRQSICALLSTAVSLAGAPLVRAQVALPDPAPVQVQPQDPPKKGPRPLRTLGAAFPLIHWDPKGRGILIAIAPDKTARPRDPDDAAATLPDPGMPLDPDDPRAPLLPPKDNYGLNVALVARHFDRKLIHLTTVSVIAPSKMLTLAREIKPANPYAGMDLEDKVKRLEGSLTPDQWKLLGSPGGIGLGDMTKEQEPLFEELIPENARIQQSKLKRDEEGDLDDESIGDGPISITDSARAGLRVRLDRSASLNLINPNGDEQWSDFEFHHTDIGETHADLTSELPSFVQSSSLFGQQLRFQTPNRLKPSDLDLTQPELQAALSVDGMKTVGDLVNAVRERTGVEIYVDGRFGRLPVAIKGAEAASVRANDILEALAWALTATYRRVGPTATDPRAVYILTFDREGIAVMRGRLRDWAERGEAERRVVTSALDKMIAAQKPHQYVSFATGDVLTPTPEALKALEDSGDSPSAPDNSVPVSTLTATQKQEVKEAIELFNKLKKDNPELEGSVRGDRVGMSLNLHLTLLVPDVGEVHMSDDLSDFSDDDSTRSAAAQDDTAAQLAMAKPYAAANLFLEVTAPRDRAQADALVAAAIERGIRQLWVRVTDSPESLAGLSFCVAAGKSHPLPVCALVTLVRAAPQTAHPTWSNINVYGEIGSAWAADRAALYQGLETDPMAMMAMMQTMGPSGDFLDPDNADARAAIAARVAAVAATPGLAGLALADAAAPGYDGSNDPGFHRSYGEDFGYTTDNRLAFIKSRGYDPIDVEPADYNGFSVRQATRLSYLNAEGAENVRSYGGQENGATAPGTIWNQFREAREKSFLKSIRMGISSKFPTMPIYVCANDATPMAVGTTRFQTWDKPDAEPFAPSDGDLIKTPGATKRLYSVIAYGPGELDQIAKFSADYAKHFTETTMLECMLHEITDADPVLKKWQGAVVLDLSAFPVADTIRLTRAVLLPAHVPKSN